MTDSTLLDKVETVHPTDLSSENGELVDYVNAYIYSGFFGARRDFEHLLGDHNKE